MEASKSLKTNLELAVCDCSEERCLPGQLGPHCSIERRWEAGELDDAQALTEHAKVPSSMEVPVCSSCRRDELDGGLVRGLCEDCRSDDEDERASEARFDARHEGDWS